ncbi:Hsp20/alpha crystallin family protein [Bacillus inaquosorum]|nr:Hsp20/alpha crystallin family protein [Bacillus inaquosorum]
MFPDRKERYAGGFHRTVTLPATVSHEGVKATYTNGVLVVRMPKLTQGNMLILLKGQQPLSFFFIFSSLPTTLMSLMMTYNTLPLLPNRHFL